MSVFVPDSGYFYCCSSVVQLETRDGVTSSSSFILGIILVTVCVCVCVFLYETENCHFKVCEELCWNFDVDCIESEDAFCGMAIFTILI